MSATAPLIAELLLPRTRLRARVAELGRSISSDHADGPDPLVVVGVLKGSTPFLADLVRAIEAELVIDFISISSYGSGAQSGVVRIIKDLDLDISQRSVVIVEDIVDTGLTLGYLRRTLAGRGPRSLSSVALLDKRARRIVPVPLEYPGFEIEDVFVVGYGLHFQGLYRNLPEIHVISDLARLANAPQLLGQQLWGGRFGDPQSGGP